MAALRIITFASGKGGVGKTSLAVNFAWSCSRVGKTLLIDLDFHNQGATSLLARHFSLGESNAFASLSHGVEAQPVSLVQNFDFLRAASWKDVAGDIGHPPDEISGRLSELISRLSSTNGYDVIVLDCHGGLEPVSLAAHVQSSVTFVATEADSVTFAGTLELLRYYVAGQAGTQLAAKIQLIVNRVSGNYKWADLKRVYERHIADGGLMREVSAVASFFPADTQFALTFGEYPFYVELAPKSTFAKKIFLLTYDVLVAPPAGLFGAVEHLRQFEKERARVKVAQTVTSDIDRYREGIVRGYAANVTMVTILVLTAIPLGVLAAFGQLDPTTWTKTVIVPIGVTFAVGFVPVLWFSYKSLFQLAFYYRDKYKFQRALLSAGDAPLTSPQRLSLVTGWFLRVGTAFIPWFGVLYVALLALALIIDGAAMLFRD